MNSWLTKYRPASSQTILGDQIKIQKVCRFLKRFYQRTQPNPCLLILGQNGVGKSVLIDLAIQESGLEKITVNLANITLQKKKKDDNVNSRTVTTFYKELTCARRFTERGMERKQIVLMIEDITSISTPKEKEAVKMLVRLNNQKKAFPLIMTGNVKHNKLVIDLKKMVTYSMIQKGVKIKVANDILLDTPTRNQMIELLDRITTGEGMTITPDIQKAILVHAQYDVRRLINLLQDLHTIYPTGLTMKVVNDYLSTSKIKDRDPGIFDTTKRLLNQFQGVEQALLHYGKDRATIPLMVHENYLINIDTQLSHLTGHQQADLMAQISTSMSVSDKTDGLIYSNQCWNLQPVHGFDACVVPSFLINQDDNKLSLPENHQYTQDYNRTSTKHINHKVIKQAREHPLLSRVSIHDFLYISMVLKTLLEREEDRLIAELLMPYRLSMKQIESIIKIDKVNKQKTPIKGKQKTRLKKLLGVDD